MKTRNVLTAILFVVLAALLSAGCTQAAVHTIEAPAETPTATFVSPISVTGHQNSYSNASIRVGISYPVIAGMEDKKAQTQINKDIYDTLQTKAHTIETLWQDDMKHYGRHGSYEFTAGYTVMRNDGVVLSISIDISTYTGGANMGTDSMFINMVNLEKAIQPSLGDLFVKETDYKKVINNEITAMNATLGEEAYEFTGIVSDGWYYLTDDSLVIVFPRYSIGPGAAGEPEFAIPLEKLSDILIPEVK